jgi:hypothetical protein
LTAKAVMAVMAAELKTASKGDKVHEVGTPPNTEMLK